MICVVCYFVASFSLFWPFIGKNVISILKKARVRSSYIEFHPMGLFPTSTMAFTKEIEDSCPYCDLRASAANFFWNAKGLQHFCNRQ
jgi:hypothetical protein